MIRPIRRQRQPPKGLSEPSGRRRGQCLRRRTLLVKKNHVILPPFASVHLSTSAKVIASLFMIDEAAIIGPNDKTTRSPRPYRNPAGSVVVKMVSLAKQGTPLAGGACLLITNPNNSEQTHLMRALIQSFRQQGKQAILWAVKARGRD